MIIASVVILAGCYQHAHSTTRIRDFGYQYDEPRDYCRTHGELPDFEMDCPNGTIAVRFVLLDQGDTVDSIMSEALDENPDSCEYSLSEMEGARSPTTLAELTNNTPEGKTCPVYIAVSKFGAHHTTYLRGYMGEGVTRKDFQEDFRIVTTTLEPY